MFKNGIPASDLVEVTWRKSEFSNSKGNCVELAGLATGQVAIRNSRFSDGPALVVDRDDLAAFISATKAGRHDDLVMS